MSVPILRPSCNSGAIDIKFLPKVKEENLTFSICSIVTKTLCHVNGGIHRPLLIIYLQCSHDKINNFTRILNPFLSLK